MRDEDLDELLHEVEACNWQQVNRKLLTHWADLCRTIFSVHTETPWTTTYDKQLIEQKLLHPLASAYCLDKSVQSSLLPLAKYFGGGFQKNLPGKLCGHVFQQGEVTYTCLQCAMDKTCVLCDQCFKTSHHKEHKYRMCSSAGSGYCDCGDIEAWKEYPSCEIHSSIDNTSFNVENNLLPVIESRIHHLTSFIIQTAVQVLTVYDISSINSLSDLFRPSCSEIGESKYQTVVFNDETHTYDSVINAFRSSLQCSPVDAMKLATIIDREGRCVVRIGTLDSCEQVAELIKRKTRRDVSQRTEKAGPLNVRTIIDIQTALQELMLCLLDWLSSQARQFHSLAIIIANILLNDVFYDSTIPTDFADHRIVTVFLHYDSLLWKRVRLEFHKIIMTSILMDQECKQAFAVKFVQNYPKVFHDYVNDDHNHSVSVISLAVQIFTIPSVARMLIEKENVMEVLMNALIEKCAIYVHPTKKTCYDFSQKSFPFLLRRSLDLFSDYKYLLCVVPSKSDWNKNLQENFLKGTYTFIKFLGFIQDMDPVVRQVLDHQMYDAEWETALNIQISMQKVVSLTVEWACSDKIVHFFLLNHIFEILKQRWSNQMKKESKITVEVYGKRARCIAFDVSKSELSIHQPIYRLFAALFTASENFLEEINFSSDEEENRMVLNLKGYRAWLCEIPLRVIVLCAQVDAQMWRRNGISLINQIRNCRSLLCRSEIYDRDILMMQIGAALKSPNIFLIRLLHKFNLDQWTKADFGDKHNNCVPDDPSKIVVTLVEELLHLIIMIVGERYKKGISEVSIEQILQHELLHALATGPKTFSELDRIGSLLSENASDIENAIKAVGDFKQPTASSPGQFTMKISLVSEFNQFFYRYSKTKISKALLHQRVLRANLDDDLKACPPPILPRLTKFFAPIRNLLISDVLLQMIRLILERTSKRSRYSSDGIFHRVLFIIGMGLNEQKMDINFNFIGMTEELGIFSSLETLVGRHEVEQNSLFLGWVLKYYKTIKSATTGKDLTTEKMDVTGSTSTTDMRKAAAEQMRRKAILLMNQKQQRFLSLNKDAVSTKVMKDSKKEQEEIDEPEEAVLSTSNDYPVCLGDHKSFVKLGKVRTITCMLCMERVEVKFSKDPLVLAAFVQASSLFVRTQPGVLNSVFLPPAEVLPGLNITTCGHAMHNECFNKHSQTLRNRDHQRQTIGVYNISAGEYLCPLCKRLSNSVLPMLPPPFILQENSSKDDISDHQQIEFADWLNFFSKMVSIITNDFDSEKPFDRSSNNRSVSLTSLDEFEKNVIDTSMSEPPIEGDSSAVHSYLRLICDDISILNVNSAGNMRSRSADFAFNSNSNLKISNKFLHLFFNLIPTNGQTNIVREINDISSIVSSFAESLAGVFSTDIIDSYFKYCLNRTVTSSCVLWQSTAFTLRSISAVLRRENKPLFGAFSYRQIECIHAISRMCALECTYLRVELMQSVFFKIIAPFTISSKFPGLHSMLEAERIGGSTSRDTALDGVGFPSAYKTSTLQFTNILCVDLFPVAVELAMCASGFRRTFGFKESEQNRIFLPSGSVNEQYALRLVLIAYIFQVFLSFDGENNFPLAEYLNRQRDTFDENTMRKTLPAIENLQRIVQYHRKSFGPPADSLCRALRLAVVEFLRPLALLYHGITLVPPPEALKDPSIDEFEPLCRYLGLPCSLEILLDDSSTKMLFNFWSCMQELYPADVIVRQPIVERILINLPEDFSELIDMAVKFRCPSSGKDEISSSSPTLCLVCGNLLCSQSYCCQSSSSQVNLGACGNHMMKCTRNSGCFFLRIRDCQVILLIPLKRGCHFPAPYVDSYGETDLGFRRGSPLKLNHQLYAKFKHIWLHQRISEEFVNQYDAEFANFEWDLF